MKRSWYLIRTKPRCDYIAATALRRHGYELYFPQVRAPWYRSGDKEVPLFPGYLFLRYDTNEPGWPTLSMLPGILNRVRFGGVVPTVPDEVITSLEIRVDAINSEGGLWTRFRRGDRVHVVSGKMEGLAEVVEEPTSPQARVRVLLEFMGRLVPAQVPVGNLSAVDKNTLTHGNRGGFRRTRGRGRWIRGVGPRALASA